MRPGRFDEEKLLLEGKVLTNYYEVRGEKAPAVMAVAHTLLILPYQVLASGQPYHDKQAPPLDQRHKERMIRHSAD